MGILGRKPRSDDGPAFGYGRGRRPLWNERDRDAEQIRKLLRKARRREWSERHGGFVVEGGQDGAPFMVACAAEPDELDLAAEVEAYTQVLTAAGMRVAPDPDPDDRALQVWIAAR